MELGWAVVEGVELTRGVLEVVGGGTVAVTRVSPCGLMPFAVKEKTPTSIKAVTIPATILVGIAAVFHQLLIATNAFISTAYRLDRTITLGKVALVSAQKAQLP